MDRDILISKWLDNNLNSKELEAFKALEDYNDLIKLNNNLQAFKSNTYNPTKELNNVLNTVKNPKKESTSWFKPFMRIAAILTICFGIYQYTTTIDTTITTDVAQKTNITLPDASNVNLNAQSSLAFNKNSWNNNRNVELNGEGYFKVAKGSTFNVNTKLGSVTVYGTQFNVKQRENYFEVICYEGLVGVTYNSKETKLNPGDSFFILDGKVITKEKENNLMPSWVNNKSHFKSLPYKEVVKEFERQYGVSITLVNIESNQLFTGSFTHNNLNLALQSITLPLHITYSKTKNTIILKSD